MERKFRKSVWKPSWNKPTQEIFNGLLDNKLGQFTVNELDTVLKKN